MNYYCDESCHLLNDDSNFMVLGTLYCQKEKVKYISKQIKAIKQKHKIPTSTEIKSTKVSKGKLDFYMDLINFFINCNELNFRAIVIDKTQLQHAEFNQTHDTFYYKMIYLLFKHGILLDNTNNIYLDFKDKDSYHRSQKVKKYLNLTKLYHNSDTRFNSQPINSKESFIMQLSDLLIGLVTYANRGLNTNTAKLALISKLENELNIKLTNTNYTLKFNILKWKGRSFDV